MNDIRNYYKYDMHVHTSESSACAKASAKDLVIEYKNQGYQGLFITDHFKGPILEQNKPWKEIIDDFLKGYRLAKKEGDKIGLDVFLGVEMRLPTKEMIEILVIGMTEDIMYNNENLNLYTIEQLNELALKENLLLIQAHPFRNKGKVIEPNYLDGYEVINGGQNTENNSKAYDKCITSNLFPLAGGDCHSTKNVSKCGIYTSDPITSEKDAVKKIRLKEYGLFANENLSINHPIYETKKFIMV